MRTTKKKLNKILFIVQSRINSERVPNKMIRTIGNSCLFEILLKKVKNTIIPLNQFYASVYDNELKNICIKNDIQIFHRSLESRNTDNNLSLMYEWWDKFPQYEWHKNFGYGTDQHLSALKKFGITNFHRKSYKPVHNILSR